MTTPEIPYVICVEDTMVRDHLGMHKDYHTGETLPSFRVNLAIRSPYFKDGTTISRPLSNGQLRDHINKWCDENCVGGRHMGKSKTIHFEREEDALLFWFTFKRKNPNG